ncbi:hypothetical protein AXF42_Ash021615 [Apostasia shenzhenica]|uniref:Uncharacterized protein n=1 Tax=Apostasia shenzhenica TaxID=1088818 RepID=A0A2H9ZUD4_9ASPA|nr:hypothetical protein AXF42_Ash021615 [Apostasia shenzhenica]
MDIQISHCPKNIATNLTTIGVFKCINKALILAKFLGFPPSAQIGKEMTRCIALVEKLSAEQRPKKFNTNSIKYI